jgi:hypothetical protein
MTGRRSSIPDKVIVSRVLRNRATQGYHEGAKEGILRHVEDLAISPSLNIARDVGAEVARARSEGVASAASMLKESKIVDEPIDKRYRGRGLP